MKLALIVLCDVPYIQSSQRGKLSQPVRPDLAYLPFLFSFRDHLPVYPPRSVTVGAVVAVLLLEEELLSDEIYSKGACRNAETRERALEAVQPGERTGVPPLLAVPL